MIAELIAVGSELLRGVTHDTNGDWLVARLERIGIAVGARGAVTDDPERLARVLRGAVDRAGLVIVTGGLGPTGDDRTREALELAFGRSIESDPAEADRLRRYYNRSNQPWTAERARQAGRPRGATWITNPIGTVAGMRLTVGESLVVVLPGVPAEMKATFESGVVPELIDGIAGTALTTRILRVAGVSESAVDARVADLYDREGLELTILARATGVELWLRGNNLDTSLETIEQEIRARLGLDLVGVGDHTLPVVIGSLLAQRGETLGTAESCTAGLIAAAITEVPGSSRWYRGGVVVYSDALKRSLVGVRSTSLERDGAVSENVARELAEGTRRVIGSDWAVSVTGIAGPGGGSVEKPVGLVCLAVSGSRSTEAVTLRLAGDRATVRTRAVTEALDRLRRALLQAGGTA